MPFQPYFPCNVLCHLLKANLFGLFQIDGSPVVPKWDQPSTSNRVAWLSRQGLPSGHPPVPRNAREPHDELNYCSRCDRSFTNPQSLRLHMQNHTGRFSFWCDLCKKGYSQKGNYKAHMAKHEGITFPCMKCDKRFKTEISLKYHQSEHTGVYLYTCSYCRKGYNLKVDFEEHVNRHKGVYFGCSICKKIFHHEGRLNAHKKKCQYHTRQ